jgi:hypothetical protein
MNTVGRGEMRIGGWNICGKPCGKAMNNLVMTL